MKRPRTVRWGRWLYRISGARRWTPVHPSQRFNFPRDNPATVYLGEDLGVCRAEVLGRTAGLIPIRLYWARARVDLKLWDLRSPGRELGRALGRLVGQKAHSWAVKALSTRSRKAGIQGILYRSLRDPRRCCVALFMENVARREFRTGAWKRLP